MVDDLTDKRAASALLKGFPAAEYVFGGDTRPTLTVEITEKITRNGSSHPYMKTKSWASYYDRLAKSRAISIHIQDMVEVRSSTESDSHPLDRLNILPRRRPFDISPRIGYLTFVRVGQHK